MDRPITRRALRKAATRVTVIEAARTVFQERGYEGATIAEIARAAEVSPGTVLNAASTKIALLNAVMTEDFRRLGADCASLRASLTSPFPETVLVLLDLHLQRHCSELDLITALLGHMWLDGGDEFRTFYSNLEHAWTPVRALVNDHAALGGLRAGVDASEAVTLIQDIYIGVLRRCAAGELDVFAASAQMRSGVTLAMRGVLAQPASPGA